MGSAGPVVHDPEAPWLVFHEECLHDVVLERIVKLYDSLAGPHGSNPSARGRRRGDLDQLRRELDDIERMLDSRRSELPGSLRPGIRRELR